MPFPRSRKLVSAGRRCLAVALGKPSLLGLVYSYRGVACLTIPAPVIPCS